MRRSSSRPSDASRRATRMRLALVGQIAFVGALALGLHLGGLQGAGQAVSLAMLLYFGFYFWRLATWPVAETPR